MKVGGRTIEAKTGDVVVIEPGTPHNFWNKTEQPVRMNVEVRPALEIGSLLETMYGLAADGKTNRWGMPNPFRLAAIADAHFVHALWQERRRLAGRDVTAGPFRFAIG